MKIDASLARGAARTMLRAADKEMSERMSARLAQKVGCSPVSDESTARAFLAEIRAIYSRRIVLLRAEFAKRHSSVMCFGLETNQDGQSTDLFAFIVSSSGGQTTAGSLGLTFTKHAMERFQQRQAGMLFDLKPFVVEFGPAIITYAANPRLKNCEHGQEALLPTASGALLAVYDQEQQEFFATTWIRNDQLRAEQLEERALGFAIMATVIDQFDRPLSRKSRFAGRKDEVSLEIQEDVGFAMQKALTESMGRNESV